MPKRFILALIIFQSLLTILHWSAYKLAFNFFPVILNFEFILLAILFCSFLFLIFSTACHYFENSVLRIGYLFSAVWLVFVFYFLLFGTIGILLYSFLNISPALLGIAVLIVATSLVTYGLINARILRITKVSVNIKNLPEFWKNKSAILATDLHFGQILKADTAKKIVKAINSQNPDIVFIPGDFYDGMHNDFNKPANEFKNLRAPLGAYFSSGNHEVYAGYELCEQAIKNSGIKILENEKIEIEGLQIIGLAYGNETAETLKQNLEKIAISREKPSILLKHVPSNLEAVQNVGVDLQLSGHTHHGQIWPFRYLTHKIFKGFDYGLKNLESLQVLTSSGVGTWGPPMKIFTKSEIVKIEFK